MGLSDTRYIALRAPSRNSPPARRGSRSTTRSADGCRPSACGTDRPAFEIGSRSPDIDSAFASWSAAGSAPAVGQPTRGLVAATPLRSRPDGTLRSSSPRPLTPRHPRSDGVAERTRRCVHRNVRSSARARSSRVDSMQVYRRITRHGQADGAEQAACAPLHRPGRAVRAVHGTLTADAFDSAMGASPTAAIARFSWPAPAFTSGQ